VPLNGAPETSAPTGAPVIRWLTGWLVCAAVVCYWAAPASPYVATPDGVDPLLVRFPGTDHIDYRLKIVGGGEPRTLTVNATAQANTGSVRGSEINLRFMRVSGDVTAVTYGFGGGAIASCTTAAIEEQTYFSGSPFVTFDLAAHGVAVVTAQADTGAFPPRPSGSRGIVFSVAPKITPPIENVDDNAPQIVASSRPRVRAARITPRLTLVTSPHTDAARPDNPFFFPGRKAVTLPLATTLHIAGQLTPALAGQTIALSITGPEAPRVNQYARRSAPTRAGAFMPTGVRGTAARMSCLPRTAARTHSGRAPPSVRIRSGFRARTKRHGR
jgi:hypothetical protein